jgi:hypothetical protein
MHRRWLAPFHTVVLAATLVQATGCSSWRSSPGLDSAAVVQSQRSRVRLRLTSGQQVELKRPVLQGDSVTGLVKGDTTRVAAADVRLTAVRRFSLGRTAVRVAIGFGLLFGLAALACAADPCGY